MNKPWKSQKSSQKSSRKGANRKGSSSKKGRGRGRAGRTRFEAEPVAGERTDYVLLDSGDGEKLERFGDILLARPAPGVIWPKRHPELWKTIRGRFTRDSKGRGEWDWRGGEPNPWLLEVEGLTFVLKPTDFGHLGIFPEQAAQWSWLQDMSAEQPEVLNLFAYTGGSTLAAARAGARVCHVDAARGIVDWARANAKRCGLEDAPVRWIVDDVVAFAARETRRDRRYRGLILDPPSYGRGSKGEIWKIEDDLLTLFDTLRPLLDEDLAFVLLSCHTPGFTPRVLTRLVQELVRRPGVIHADEMLLEAEDPEDSLPIGAFARWSKPMRDGETDQA